MQPPGARSTALHAQERLGWRQSLTLLIPTEHGSWGMLLAVLILPHALFRLNVATWALGLAAIFLFFVRRPIEIALHPRRSLAERVAARRWAWVLGLVAASLSLTAVSWAWPPSPALLGTAIASITLVTLGTLLESPGRRPGSFIARLFSMVGVAMFVPLQVMLSGQPPGPGWAIGLLCLCSFIGSALRVRRLLRGRHIDGLRPMGLLVSTALPILVAALGTARGGMPPFAYVALLPSMLQTWRTFMSRARRVNVMRLGVGEILHTAAFVLLTILAFRL